MKITEYLLFLAVMVPTILLLLAAIISLAQPAPRPAAYVPATMVSSAGLYPANLPEEWDVRL
jgi:hypothetical protein